MRLIRIITIGVMSLVLCGCHKGRQEAIFDTNLNEAYVRLPDGRMKLVAVQKWAQYGETVVIKTNEKIMCTHMNNVIFFTKLNEEAK